MINEQGNHARIARLFGDGELLLRFVKSPFWVKLVTKDGKPHLSIVNEIWHMTVGMLAYNSSVFFRFKYGARTTGIILTLATILQMVAFNSEYLFTIVKPFYPFFAPALLPFKDNQYWTMLVFERVQSKSMLYYTICFSVLSIFHTACIYLGFGNKSDPTKRGTSLLHEYVFKYTIINQYIIQAAIEPLLVGGIASLWWFYFGDKTFGTYLGLSAVCMFAQELLDHAHQTRMRMSIQQFE